MENWGACVSSNIKTDESVSPRVLDYYAGPKPMRCSAAFRISAIISW